MLRCAQNEDILTLKAEDSPDVVNLVFESSESDRMSEYDIKLMDIDQEHLGIPETQYAATISLPSAEFQRICRDLSALSESVAIECTKEGVKFACNGDIGSGATTLRSHTNVDKPELNVDIALSEPVALTFSLKYLVNFCKASGLSGSVKLCLSNEVPLLVEYTLQSGSHLRFYLAPKVGFGPGVVGGGGVLTGHRLVMTSERDRDISIGRAHRRDMAARAYSSGSRCAWRPFLLRKTVCGSIRLNRFERAFGTGSVTSGVRRRIRVRMDGRITTSMKTCVKSSQVKPRFNPALY